MSANFKRTALSLAVLSVFSVVAHSADIDASQDNITYQVTQGETIGSVTVSGGHSASIAGDEINITGAIKVTTSGQPDSTSSSLTIGTNTTESVKISVETGNAFNTNGSKLDIYGQEIHIQTASDNAFGGYGEANIGNSETKLLEISGGEYGVSVLPYKNDNGNSVSKSNGKLTLTADEVVISASVGGIWAQNNSTGSKDDYAPVTINADTIRITAGKMGVVAMSRGTVKLNGNTYITAPDAILARGGSIVTINEDNTNIVQLDGNIDFNYDEKTSGTDVDAKVTLNLTGSESHWNGNALNSYTSISKIPDTDTLSVNNLSVSLSEGATWNVGSVQETSEDKEVYNDNNELLYRYKGQGQVAVSTLTLNKGTINIGDNVAKIQTLNVNGVGNQVIVSDPSSTKDQLVISNGINFSNGSELITNLNTVYTADYETVDGVENVLTSANAKLDAGIDGEGSATLTITDEFTYSTEGLTALTGAYSDLTLNLLNATLVAGQEAILTDGCIQSSEEVSTTVSAGTSGEASVAVKNSGGQSLVVKGSETESVSSVKFTKQDSATTGNLTLVGSAEGGALVKNAEGEAIAVTVADGVTLNLGTAGSEVETAGSLADVTLAEGGAMNVQNIAVDVNKLTTENKALIIIGNEVHRGSLSVNELALAENSTIFLDPAWSGDAALDTVANASHLAVSEITALNGNLIAGQNSLVAVGATADEAVAGFNALTAANSGLGWGESNVTAALYVAKPISFAAGSTGKIVVDGNLTALPTDLANYADNVNIAEYGMLMIDQAAIGSETAAINGTLSLADGSYVGLVNANEGTIKLANTVNVAQGDVVDVVTDNPFITAALSQDGNSVAASLDAANGLGALASTGLQAMTRRADSVLAGTIADRTSIDQELNAGINLWVDVRGENYQADNFDNGGEFDADMGYGTFGGDMAFGAFTAGAAFQYGTGSLRSSVSSIKNSIDNYAFSLYGTYKVTDAFKLAAELAYVWGENDITSSQAALNQSVDTEMYSFGLRAMYELKAGNFSFVPSIGLRVSQLSTDAFQVGSVKVEDQDQTLVQVPIALRINASEINASGWAVTPSFKIAYVPTFGDKDIEVLNHTQDVIDTAPVQADFGLRIGKDNMMFNVNMLLGAGEYGTSAIGGKVGFKYAF